MENTPHYAGINLWHQFPESLNEAAIQIGCKVKELGGRAWLVGGCIRDALYFMRPAEIDIEVFGLGETELEAALNRFGRWDSVGKAFGVYKIKGRPIDISLPRREIKSGRGHRGFAIESNPGATLEEACSRRDFTINAILWDPLTGELADPLDGWEDLRRKKLRHCSTHFSEDPLRVLRAMQFIARFDLDIDPETLALCRQIEPEDLPPERIFEEWKKCIIKGVRIGRGLEFLKESGWIRYFPELEALVKCPQEPDWHPEGDVWTHVGHCMDAFARRRIGDEWEDLVVGLAVLCHDLGKPETTQEIEGRIRSLGHPEAGVPRTRSLLQRMTRQKQLIEAVLPLVKEHHRPVELYRAKASDAAIRRLARRVHRIDRLIRVARADQEGRPPLPSGSFPEGSWLAQKAEKLTVSDSVPAPLVRGRDLINLGLKPGPQFKPILDACYEAQLDGVFTDEAGGREFLNNYLRERGWEIEPKSTII